MNRRNMILGVFAAFNIGSLAKAKSSSDNKVLLDYELSYNDEFGAIFRRTLEDGNDTHKRFVKRIVMLPDLSLQVTSYDMIVLEDKSFKFRRDSNWDTMEVYVTIPKNLWCINVYDAQGELPTPLKGRGFRFNQ